MGEINNTNIWKDSNKMIDRLIKRLMKMFVPSPQTLAKMASKQSQDAVNGCQKAERIAKCANIAASVTDIQKFVSDTLMDCKVSDAETQRIEEKLIPLF